MTINITLPDTGPNLRPTITVMGVGGVGGGVGSNLVAGAPKEKTYLDDIFSVYTYRGFGNNNRDIVNDLDLADKGGMVIQKVRDYWTNQEPIPWVRIYKVADHVHFPHMRHVAANVDCTTCHGEVKEMDVIATVNQPLSMGWCVSCHVEQDVRRDCTVCHY